jgi:hypothetical protein
LALRGHIARKLGRLYRWRERFWARRYQAIVVSDEEEAQIARLVYILRHGCKEGLVARPSDWPGVHVVDELCQGHNLVHGGIWHDQSGEYEARRRGEEIHARDYESRYSIELSALPCWRHRAARDVASIIRGLVRLVIVETRADHELRGVSPLGTRAVLRQSPHHSPKTTKRSPAPWVHAASKEARLAMIEAYRVFVAVFRSAAASLRAGDRHVRFPEGCFPPGLPWVPEPRPGPV